MAGSDDFNRADSDSLGSNWSEDIGDADIIGNACGSDPVGGGGHISARWVGTGPATNDYYVEAVVNSRSNNSRGAGPMARKTAGTGATNDDGYCMMLYNGDQFYLTRMDNGVETSLGTWASTPADNTDYTLRIRVSGNQISGYVDGTLRIGPVTDSTYSTGAPGLHFFDADGPRADSWSFFDLATDANINPNRGRPAPFKPGIGR
jgi:hypothetical protein